MATQFCVRVDVALQTEKRVEKIEEEQEEEEDSEKLAGKTGLTQEKALCV